MNLETYVIIVGLFGFAVICTLLMYCLRIRNTWTNKEDDNEEEINISQCYAETIIDYLYSLEQPDSEYYNVTIELRSIKLKVPAECNTAEISQIICDMDSDLKAHEKGIEGEDKILSVGFK